MTTGNENTNSNFTNIFANPFSSKPESNNDVDGNNAANNETNKENTEPQSNKEKMTEGGEEEEEEEGNAINSLIYHSFFPATCMVSLDENIITRETVPDLMKAKDQDGLLQETIKTFHGLMKEKDDEILNLKKQLQAADKGDSKVAKVMSVEIQTDLTLDKCETMERQLTELSKDIPLKIAKIAELEKTKEELNKKMADMCKSPGRSKSLQKRDSRLTTTMEEPQNFEEDLEQAYKDLMDLEQQNAALAEENGKVKKNLQELGWQYEELYELKAEIEAAKITREHEMSQLEHEMEKLKGNDDKVGNTDFSAEEDHQSVKDKDKIIKELQNYVEVLEEKNDSSEKSAVTLLPITSKYVNLESSSRKGPITNEEMVESIVEQIGNGKLLESDLINASAVLSAIDIDENGNIDSENLQQRTEEHIKKLKKIPKNELEEKLTNESIRRAFDALNRIKYGRLTFDELGPVYHALDMILHLMNKNFKNTSEDSVRKYSKKVLIEYIIERKRTIFEISLHHFWKVCLDEQSKENKYYSSITMTAVDKNTLINNIFTNYPTTDKFVDYLTKLVGIRNLLLIGTSESSTQSILTDKPLFNLKLQAAFVIFDLVAHILPMYPSETRFGMFYVNLEEKICADFKVMQSISEKFIKILNDVCGIDNEITGSNQTFYPRIFFEYIFNIIDIMNFEADIFEESGIFSTNNFNLTTMVNGKSKSGVKYQLKSNIKDYLINKILEIHLLIPFNADCQLINDLKSKSEQELARILLEKKDNILLMLFDDKFNPTFDKNNNNNNNNNNNDYVFLSCVNSERNVKLDFWCKIINHGYEKEQQQHLSEFQLDELKISLERLKDVEKILNISTLSDKINMKDRNSIIKHIFKSRIKIKNYLRSSVFNHRHIFYLTSDLEEMTKGLEVHDKKSSNSFIQLKKYLNMTDIGSYRTKLHNLMKRLNEIDLIIYPGWVDEGEERINKQFENVTDHELVEEIIFIRLSIIYYSHCLFETNDELQNNSDLHNYDAVKQLNNALIKVKPDCVDGKIMKYEVEECKILSKNLENLNDDKLNFIYSKLNITNTTNDISSTDFEGYDKNKKIKLLEKKIQEILKQCEVEKNIEVDKKESKLENNEYSAALNDISKKLIELLTTMNSNKTVSMKQPIKSKDIINYLNEIQNWIIHNQNLKKQLHSKLTNLNKKLHSKIGKDKIETKMANIDFSNTEQQNYEDEKEAFEKTFMDLEKQINQINVTGGETAVATNSASNYYNFKELNEKENDELKRILINAEKELADDKWNESMEKEAEEWANFRSREELLDDCKSLMYRMMVLKMNNVLSKSCRKPKVKKRAKVNKDDKMLEMEDDIEKKLKKYKELCETVEKLQVPSNMAQTSQKMMRSPSPSPVMPIEKDTNYDEYEKCHSFSHRLKKNHYEDEISDDYFQKRLADLQKLISAQDMADLKTRDIHIRKVIKTDPDVIVDGFEIEDDKTPRYYSMLLQDIQHQRIEDEMGSLLHHMNKHQQNMIEENRLLKHKLYVSQNLIDTQQTRIELLEKSKEYPTNDGHGNISNSETNFLQEENQRLVKALSIAESNMDKQNSEVLNLAANNATLQNENQNLNIKNHNLERTLRKLEVTYKDLMEQLEFERSKNMQVSNNEPINTKSDYNRMESKFRKSERDKVELVHKLDLLEEQNRLLKVHCEKLDNELIRYHKILGDSKTKNADNQKEIDRLNQKLREQIHNRQSKGQSREEEIARLRSRVLELETKLVVNEEAPSHVRLREELISQRDKEISRLKKELGMSRDLLEEAKAQLDVKDYENRKLVKSNKQLQSQQRDSQYFPPPGYRLVRDST